MLYTKDQFGFYKIGDLKFYSKMEAIEMHTRTGHHPHWDFNENVFDLYDWSVEPKESLSELYKKRAQQLRDRYDYLVLWYSSGADSHNILQSFLDNDIKLDEIASFVNYDGTHDKNDFYLNGEIYNIATENVKKYQEQYPDLQHRIVDMCQSMVNFFESPEILLNWKYRQNTLFNVNASVRSTIFREVEHWKNLINSGKKVGFIWGKDKPRLSIVDGKYCFRFLDIIDDSINPAWQNEPDQGEYIEYFYWSPDMPELMIKQGHVVKRYLQSATELSPWMGEESTGLGFTVINGKKLWISTIGVNSLVYPGYSFNALNEFKPTALFWTPREAWFQNLGESNKACMTWKNSLQGIWNDVPDYWKNDPTDATQAFKCCFSKPYFLE
jgi:hypothetical protein